MDAATFDSMVSELDALTGRGAAEDHPQLREADADHYTGFRAAFDQDAA